MDKWSMRRVTVPHRVLPLIQSGQIERLTLKIENEVRPMKKTFTIGEVQTLLPVLEALMMRAQQAGLKASVLGAELEELRQKIFVSGGMHVDVTDVAQQRSQQNAAIEEAKATVAEMEEIGAKLHDLGEGLLDLPYRVDGRDVMLCWKVGEATIGHWHEEEEEPTERLPLNEHFGRGEWERLN